MEHIPSHLFREILDLKGKLVVLRGNVMTLDIYLTDLQSFRGYEITHREKLCKKLYQKIDEISAMFSNLVEASAERYEKEIVHLKNQVEILKKNNSGRTDQPAFP